LCFTYDDVSNTLALERSFNTMLAVQGETLSNLYEGGGALPAMDGYACTTRLLPNCGNLTPIGWGSEPYLGDIFCSAAKIRFPFPGCLATV
jgi:hypothetical protein